MDRNWNRQTGAWLWLVLEGGREEGEEGMFLLGSTMWPVASVSKPVYVSSHKGRRHMYGHATYHLADMYACFRHVSLHENLLLLLPSMSHCEWHSCM